MSSQEKAGISIALFLPGKKEIYLYEGPSPEAEFWRVADSGAEVRVDTDNQPHFLGGWLTVTLRERSEEIPLKSLLLFLRYVPPVLLLPCLLGVLTKAVQTATSVPNNTAASVRRQLESYIPLTEVEQHVLAKNVQTIDDADRLALQALLGIITQIQNS